jgi:hypothetical protein
MSNKIAVILCTFITSLFLTTSCIPPRCKVSQCHVVIDHSHPTRGTVKSKTKSGKLFTSSGMRRSRVVRGVPWYKYIFRRSYKAKSAKGRYRKIDTREAYDK